MKRVPTAWVIATVVTVLAVAGIVAVVIVRFDGDPARSASQSRNSDSVSGVDATTSAPSGNPDANERGNLEKELGEKGGIMCDVHADPSAIDGVCDLAFSLDKVTTCTGEGYHGDPVDGMRRIAWFTVTTSADYGSTDYQGQYPALNFSGMDLRFIGAESGVSTPVDVSMTWKCVPRSQRFPEFERWQPSTTYAGGIEIVIPEASGTLVLAPEWMQGQGWEWPITS